MLPAEVEVTHFYGMDLPGLEHWYRTCKPFFKAVLRIQNKSFGSGVGSGTVPLTNGSGSGRLKNMVIQILNTDQTFKGLPSATNGLLKGTVA